MASIVPITGGFGNQMFQYAFARYIEKSKGIKVIVDCEVGNPRRVKDSVALLGLKFERSGLTFYEGKSSIHKVYARIYGWNLVSRLEGFKRNQIEWFAVRNLSKLLFFLRYRHFYTLKPSSDLGFEVNLSPEDNHVYFGYFQTFRYASSPELYGHLMSLTPKLKSEHYSLISNEIKHGINVLIHLRFTDYLKESKFGIPSLDYYRNALQLMEKKLNIDAVWVATDDISMAKFYLRDLDVNYEIKFMDQSQVSDLEVWDLMRDFSGYVISNSTYAWWAAYLRRNVGAPVFAPDPWFKGMSNPNQLIPDSWIKVSSL